MQSRQWYIAGMQYADPDLYKNTIALMRYSGLGHSYLTVILGAGREYA